MTWITFPRLIPSLESLRRIMMSCRSLMFSPERRDECGTGKQFTRVASWSPILFKTLRMVDSDTIWPSLEIGGLVHNFPNFLLSLIVCCSTRKYSGADHWIFLPLPFSCLELVPFFLVGVGHHFCYWHGIGRRVFHPQSWFNWTLFILQRGII